MDTVRDTLLAITTTIILDGEAINNPLLTADRKKHILPLVHLLQAYSNINLPLLSALAAPVELVKVELLLHKKGNNRNQCVS